MRDYEGLLSVIVPVYNVEAYLKRCIESVIGQTYKNLEIILVDDGSSDESGNICESYAMSDQRIKVIHQENKGLSGARNTGVKNATGEYVAFFDSDDWLDLTAYEKMIKLVKENKLDIVVCTISKTNGINTEKIGAPNLKDNYVIQEKDVFECYFKSMIYVVVWNKIYRREIIKGIISPEPYQNEDNYVSGRYLYRARRMMVIDEPLYYYWDNPKGIMATGRMKRPLDLCICTQKLIEDLISEENIENKYIRQLNHKQARGVYHFIRDDNVYCRVSSISKVMYHYLWKNLDLRRWFCLLLLLWRKNIQRY